MNVKEKRSIYVPTSHFTEMRFIPTENTFLNQTKLQQKKPRLKTLFMNALTKHDQVL